MHKKIVELLLAAGLLLTGVADAQSFRVLVVASRAKSAGVLL